MRDGDREVGRWGDRETDVLRLLPPSAHRPISPSTSPPITPSPSLRRARRGVSLLEVLVSIFILLFGLLAVAAVIPLAGLRIVQIGNADRSAACGAAGLRDIKTRRMIDPETWLWRDTASAFDNVCGTSGGKSTLVYERSFAIDPLGFGHDLDDDDETKPCMRRFPYYYLDDWCNMRRITLERDPVNAPLKAWTLALAERVFTWQDDLNIPVPADDGARPLQMIYDDTGNASTSTTNAMKPQINGAYSWLATVTPDVDSPDPGAGSNRHYIDNHRAYTVSIVVFFNRDFVQPGNFTGTETPTPGERVVSADILDGTDTLYGGGEVRLFAPLTEDLDGDGTPDDGEDLDGDGLVTTVLGPEYLDVREGEWLMLCGSDSTTGRDVFRWYRIVAAGETLNEDLDGDGVITPPAEFDGGNTTGSPYEWFREVTVAGPDWNFGTPDNAALFTNVIGVYTTTIELDDGPLW